jgi:FHS family L-fucose permease-like MFS transporter
MKRNYLIVILILLTFFVISFLTNILGALNPNVSASYTLTETMAGFLPFAFFIAYGIMSIPSGILVEKWGEKRMMILAFVFAFSGALLFAIARHNSMSLLFHCLRSARAWALCRW